jgi:hypothetical protein
MCKYCEFINLMMISLCLFGINWDMTSSTDFNKHCPEIVISEKKNILYEWSNNKNKKKTSKTVKIKKKHKNEAYIRDLENC